MELKKKLKRSANPDFLFLEPSEMIVTEELRNVARMGLRDIKYDIGPFVTLIDGPSFSFHWQERPKLLLGQIQDADKIALSRVDLIDAEEVDRICGLLDLGRSDLLQLSKEKDSVIKELAQYIAALEQG